MIVRIPIKKELIRRRIPMNNQLCLRCGIQEETVDHVICGSTSSKSVWKKILVWLKIPTSTEFCGCREALEYVNDLTGSNEWKKVIRTVFQTTVWNIWKSRNEKEFEDKLRTSNDIVETIMADSFIWLKSRAKLNDIVWVRWTDFNIRDLVS
ncbi:uncharacterized protein LOC110892477 [Helianthus annuus]|uniref:uncharacterized protein LOC110892477 n=1 Tax=Helianthus annuus TaxID=4232 RepID=UPI000B8FB051|nr:uncharacterized protein LOC110892477 [Helianthus annuus]